MKTFLLIFIFALSLKADSMYNAKCVNSYSIAKITPTSYNLQIIYSDNTISNFVGSTASSLDVYLNVLIQNDGLFTVTKQGNVVACGSKTTTDTKVLISSLTGILIGFTILFFSIFLTIKVGSRK